MHVSATDSTASLRRIQPACILASLTTVAVAIACPPLAAQLPADRLVQLADEIGRAHV